MDILQWKKYHISGSGYRSILVRTGCGECKTYGGVGCNVDWSFKNFAALAWGRE